MEQEEPKEGDEQLGIITVIEEHGYYWKLTVPGLIPTSHRSVKQHAYIVSRNTEKEQCPVNEEQICMFRYSLWVHPDDRSGPPASYYWQPVLDYFTEGQPSSLAVPSLEDQD